MKYLSVKELSARGLLFEINRRVLHPLGLAISIDVERDDETDEITLAKFSDIWDCQEDPEGVFYHDELFATGLQKYQDYMEREGNARLETRREILGYTVQGEDD